MKSKLKIKIPSGANEIIYTLQSKGYEGLIKIAKETFTKIIIDSCKSEFNDSKEDKEFYEDVRNNISEYASFYAKVREGETWNKEMGKVAIKKITDEIKNNSYKQV